MKEDQYKTLASEIKSIIEGESNFIANLSNVIALIHFKFNFWWTGFYFVEDGNLVLGPFQGPVACTRISFGKGVCGTSLKEEKTIVVEDVHKFPGHIACSSESNSEIVVPIFKENKIVAVLDIDSKEYGTFDAADKAALEDIAVIISTLF